MLAIGCRCFDGLQIACAPEAVVAAADIAAGTAAAAAAVVDGQVGCVGVAVVVVDAEDEP